MNNERNKKLRLLTGLAEIYGFSFTTVTMELYLGALQDVSSEDLRRLLDFGIKNQWKFMPKPFEILEITRLSDATSNALSGKEEFDKIVDSIRRHGRNKQLQLSEAGYRSLRQIGGIDRIADATNEELTWIRKEFEECFGLNSDHLKIENRQNQLTSGEKLSDQRDGLRLISGGIGRLPWEKKDG